MSLANIAIGLPAVPAFLYLVVTWGSRRSLDPRISILVLVALAMSVYLIIVAACYERIFVLTPQREESVFFAVQTLTTVGYGAALSSVEQAKDAPAELRNFQVVSCFAMLFGSVLSGMLISAIVNAAFPTKEQCRLGDGALVTVRYR